MILFYADVGVKENRRSLLCKKSGDDREICEIEEPSSRAGLSVRGEEGGCYKILRRKMAK
jgi:hypothetical protein